MPKATSLGGGGPLNPIDDCYIIIPYEGARPPESGRQSPTFKFFDKYVQIIMDNLPDISDTKSANYADETIIGRSNPVKTYSQSDNRSISMQLHFIVSKQNDLYENLAKLRAIQSAVYPREGEGGGSPFIPPPVCKMKCGNLLGTKEICVILKSYSVKFPTDVAWDDESKTFTPYKFDIDTTWDVVYSSSNLPGQNEIFNAGA
jgi:hypothetical protein